MSLTAVILAAGQSTRMKSRRPKPLHEICGRPMLDYILRACGGAGCTKIIVVVGYGKDEVIGQFGGDERIVWVEQKERRGTGDAVRVCMPELRKVQGEVIILAGDVPLVRAEVLKKLLQAHRGQGVEASLATAELKDATGYGRILRDEKGEFVEIREHIDCDEKQLKISEVFPSIYCVKVEPLIWALGQLKDDNRKREFYLTDIYRHLRSAGKRVLAMPALLEEDVLAPNSRQELALADALMQARIVRELRETGVTVSANAYIEDGATVGQDTVIHPFSFVGRDASIGSDCTIGPFGMVPRGAIVPDGAVVAGNVGAESVLAGQGSRG